MVNDPIADMLTRIRNASLVQHPKVVMPTSKIKVGIAKILTSPKRRPSRTLSSP